MGRPWRPSLGRLRGYISPDAVNALAGAIQQQEGFYPGSLAWSNNNPGNLVFVGQPGATAGAGGFAKYSSYSAGLQALKNQISLDAARGSDVSGRPTTTVRELITSWAPPSQNDTNAYIAAVVAATGYDPDAPLSSLGSGPGIAPPAAPDVTPGSLPDLPVFTSTNDNGGGPDLGFTVDLSALGFPSTTPAVPVVMAGLVGLALISRIL